MANNQAEIFARMPGLSDDALYLPRRGCIPKPRVAQRTLGLGCAFRFLPRRGWIKEFALVIFLFAFAGFAHAADAEFHHDFRGHPLPRELGPFNVAEDGLMTTEPEGLRITLPKAFIHKWGGVGVRSEFGLKGDFDIIATFEILHADRPPGGFGAGVCLAIGAEGGLIASVARLVRAQENEVIFWDWTHGHVNWGVVPCLDKIARLRLKRTGTTLAFLWAPGDKGDDFQVINKCEFGNADIDRVRFTVLNGRTSTIVDARLLDLRIQSGNTINVASRGLSATLVVGLGFTMAIIIAVSTWLFLRGRRQAVKTTDEAEITEA